MIYPETDPPRPSLETSQASLEEQALKKLGGLDHCLDREARGYPGVTGRNFLSAYTDLAAQQETIDMLEGFMDMDPSEPGYLETRDLLANYVAAFFGPPEEA